MDSTPILPTAATISPPMKTDNVNPIDLHTGLWHPPPSAVTDIETLAGQNVLWRNPQYGPPSSAPPAGPLPPLPAPVPDLRSSIIDLDELEPVEGRAAVLERRKSTGEPEEVEVHSRTEHETVEQRRNGFAEQMKRNLAAQKMKEIEEKKMEMRGGVKGGVERIEVVDLVPQAEDEEEVVQAGHRFVEVDGVEEGSEDGVEEGGVSER